MNYDSLVLSGGASRGILTLGALKYAHEMNYLKKVEYYSGTSIGAILCALLCVGYTPDELYPHTQQLFERLLSEISISTDCLSRGGLCSNENLIRVCMDLISDKIQHHTQLTLLEFYVITKKYIFICATNLNTQSPVYFNHITHPDLRLDLALRMSCNLPIVFTQINYNGEYYVDGFLSDNLPLKPVENCIPLIINLKCENPNTVINGNIEYYTRILRMCTRSKISQNTNHRIFNIDTKRYPLLLADKDMISPMYIDGYNQFKAIIKRFNK